MHERMNKTACKEGPGQRYVSYRHHLRKPQRQRETMKQNRGLELIVQVGRHTRRATLITPGEQQLAVGGLAIHRVGKTLNRQPCIKPEHQREMRQHRPEDNLWRANV